MAGTELLRNRLYGTAEYNKKTIEYIWGPGGDSRPTFAEMRRCL